MLPARRMTMPVLSTSSSARGARDRLFRALGLQIVDNLHPAPGLIATCEPRRAWRQHPSPPWFRRTQPAKLRRCRERRPRTHDPRAAVELATRARAARGIQANDSGHLAAGARQRGNNPDLLGVSRSRLAFRALEESDSSARKESRRSLRRINVQNLARARIRRTSRRRTIRCQRRASDAGQTHGQGRKDLDAYCHANLAFHATS